MNDPDALGELLALIDRLEGLIERTGLAELEIGSSGTSIVLRRSSPGASEGHLDGVSVATAGGPSGGRRTTSSEPEAPGLHAVRTPLTGIFYHSPSPGARPYLGVGSEVISGQVIGLIEAMKLFNEIKSDVTGVVRRFAAEDGSLVKARQALIEVDVA